MFEQDNIILVISLGFLASIALSVLITRWNMNKKFNQKISISKELKSIKSDHLTLSAELEISSQELEKVDARTKKLQELEVKAGEIADQLVSDTAGLDQVNQELLSKKIDVNGASKNLNSLMKKIDLYSRVDELVEYGMFDEPDYLFDTSLKFREKIKHIRSEQKDLISEDLVITGSDDTVIEGVNNVEAKRVIKGQKALMIKSLNIEADLLISKVNPANFTKTLERINKLADGIEKHAVSFNYGISEEYTKLKYDECTLNYQYKLLKQEEAEEQKAIKEMIREEQRVAKEYEKAIADAQQEENLYQNLLNKAQQELANASADQKSEFEAKIKQLEADLEESKLNNVRTMSMAQQTKRGHVYVISNIGSFGGDVYKIGLTRRLEPLDRVKELGDASVPFIFDVHALICVEDAPALESALHKKFTHKRVNAVNHRKEFFRTDLQSIQNAVLEIAGIDADFKTTIVADEYYQTQRLTGGNKHAEKHNAVEPLLEVSLI